MYSTLLQYAVVLCAALHCTVLFCTALYCSCTVLYLLRASPLQHLIPVTILLYLKTESSSVSDAIRYDIIWYDFIYYPINIFILRLSWWNDSMFCLALLAMSWHCTALHCAPLIRTALLTLEYTTHNTAVWHVLHKTLHCNVLFCTILNFAVVHCTTLFWTILHCTVLYYTVLCCIFTSILSFLPSFFLLFSPSFLPPLSPIFHIFVPSLFLSILPVPDMGRAACEPQFPRCAGAREEEEGPPLKSRRSRSSWERSREKYEYLKSKI